MESIKQQQNINIGLDEQQITTLTNKYIDDLKKIIPTNTTIPSHTPKKFIDCFWIYNDNLYVYINGGWKSLGGIIQTEGTSFPDATISNGNYFYKTDTDTLYRSNGTAWIAIN